MSAYDYPFRSIAKSTVDLDEILRKDREGKLPFGVQYLDDLFRGIAKTDLILLGGRSGGGKTELATHIALTNALAGKKVYYYALEAERDEMMKRTLYKRLAQRFYRDQFKAPGHIAYDAWLDGGCEEQLERYVREERANLLALDNFEVRYSTFTYGLPDFEKDMEIARKDGELVVLDHLHYLDVGDEESNAAYKMAVKKIRQMALELEIPVILVAHIRKADRKSAVLCPEQEDFHGSSDIVKICTKAITIASAVDHVEPSDHSYPTFLRAAKYRRNGSAERYIGLCSYNFRVNAYDEEYTLGRQKRDKDGPYFDPITFDRVPEWAKHNRLMSGGY